jgi:cellulose synthase/poly-beta-1,6-N-acetylglucosamine synthase-like glycosyltransferase
MADGLAAMITGKLRAVWRARRAARKPEILATRSPATLDPDAVARREILASLNEQLASGQISDYWAHWGAARDGARVVVTRRQKIALVSGVVLPAVLLVAWPHATLVAAIALITGIYLVVATHKIWLLVRGERAKDELGLAHALVPEDQLPPYTILVPLYREDRMLPALVARLSRIDYPKDRLQILLLVEMDDDETQRAVDVHPLPPHIRPMTMPPGQPRTKPRALNIGLREATGEYLVIYDAEDEPEPDQLRKAVAAFDHLPQDVVSVQARLKFYNPRDSVLTRLFAVDYALWYEELLPGLARAGTRRSGAFVPLGGTSNHFRVGTLRRLGGWDPFNVTEDCDLGVRLGRAGWRVAMIDSVTWEEAVRDVRPWVAQRSRWVKGYIQTYLVHMRHPWRLWRELGGRGFADFQMLVGASALLLLLNPLMWILTGVYLVAKGTPLDTFLETLFPAPVYYSALLSLTLGNFVLFYINAYVCVRHKLLDLTRYTLLTPLYWVLLSIGAWAGMISLLRAPFYWAKTDHGTQVPDATDPTPLRAGSAG